MVITTRDKDIARSKKRPGEEDFAAMLDEMFGASESFEGRVVHGTVTAIENDMAVIDIGLKSEGRVPLREFAAPGQKADLKIGDDVEVYVDRVENVNGEAMLSRDRARREAAWDKLETEFAKTARVEGVIFGRVKGGFTVDLSGAVAFLPGSQVDIRPVRDVTPLMDIPQPFLILKMDRKRGNIVVSRRAVLEETRAEQRSGLIRSLHEGQIIEGMVKNVTDYGAFVDLGGIDGLLHVTDLSYTRVGHPNEVLNIGDTVRVQIIRINKDTQRISLGMKQIESDPWDSAATMYPVGAKLSGRVTNITEYGAFVQLESGIEGLVNVSEMGWANQNVHPGEIVSTSQEVEVLVLKVDREKRRILLSLTQCEREVADARAQETVADINPRRTDDLNRSSETTASRQVDPAPSGAFADALTGALDVRDRSIRHVVLGAQVLLDSTAADVPAGSISAATLESAGVLDTVIWRTALNALHRVQLSDQAERLGHELHRTLIALGRDELVPDLFAAQAAGLIGAGDEVGGRIYAVEAARGFVMLERYAEAASTLDLARL